MTAADAAMRAPRSLLDRIFDLVPLALGSVGGLGIFAILALMSYEIVARYLFNAPTNWSVEVSTYILVGSAYAGAGYAHQAGANIRVELLLAWLQPPLRRALEEISAWCGLAFVLIAAWQVALFTLSNYVNGTSSYILQLPQWIPNFPIFVGLVGLALALLGEIRKLRAPVSPLRDWIAPAALLIAVIILFVIGPRSLPVGSTLFDWGTVALLAAAAIAAFAWSGPRIALGAIAVCGGIGVLVWLGRLLSLELVVLLLFALVLFVFFIGVRIALGLGLLGVASLYALLPFPLPATIAERALTSVESFSLTALPMFVLMGGLLVRSGIATEMFVALLRLIGRVPGGIAHASVGACTLFAAVSGSSVATAATIGGIACPEMIRHGYSPRLAYGSVAAGGTLGILIPPSVPLIIYGTLAGVSVSQLFIAGIVPGLLVAAAFMATVFLWAVISPRSAPRAQSFTAIEKLKALVGMLPFLAMMVLILGSMYLGIVTPTEAGAVGALLALILCLARRRISWQGFWDSILETLTVTAFILLIMFGASLMTYVFDYLRLAQSLVGAVKALNMSPAMVLLVVAIIYIVLGMFLDSISLITMTLPVVFPMMTAIGFDPVWLGILLVVLVEIGLITPPVGMNLFVLQGVGKIAMKEIVYGTIPFFVVMVLAIPLFYAWPEIVLWLPANMK